MDLEAHRLHVENLEEERRKIDAHRFAAQGELRRLQIACDANPRNAALVYDQVPLNKSIEADSTRLAELDRDIKQVRRHLEFTEAQELAKARVTHCSDRDAAKKSLV